MQPKLPLNLAGDGPEMREAIAALIDLGVRVQRTSKFQLKVGPINFWPNRGTITIDGKPPLKEKGLDEFLTKIPRPRKSITLADLVIAAPSSVR
jgi:hypothetical protein